MMEKERKMFDRELTAKVMSTALDSATSGMLASIKAVSMAHEQSMRSAATLLEQAEAAAAQNRELGEELAASVKKYTSELQKLYIDAWGQWAEGLKLPEAAVPAEKKKA